MDPPPPGNKVGVPMPASLARLLVKRGMDSVPEHASPRVASTSAPAPALPPKQPADESGSAHSGGMKVAVKERVSMAGARAAILAAMDDGRRGAT